MPEKTPQDYAKEMMEMYRSKAKQKHYQDVIQTPVFEDGTGGLSVNVTTLSRLYPVNNAVVSIFTGSIESPNIVESGVTNESGKSGIFKLKTPPKSDSQQSGVSDEPPYATYNISVRSDGYVEQIALDIPVFSGVVSVQGIDLLPISAAGQHTNPQIINEGNDYNL